MEVDIINDLKIRLQKALENLEGRFNTVRAGRANPSSLDTVSVEYYGSMTPLKQLAIISVPEANQLLIKPFDKSALSAIEKAILVANLGYNPGNDGETIRIVIPPLTEERRKELTRQVKSLAEEAKIAVRNIRRDILTQIEKEEISEDQVKGLEKEVQHFIDEYNKKIEDKYKEKERDLLTI